MNLFSRFIASFFFVGYFKKIPGTMGSLAGLLVWALFIRLQFSQVVLLFIFLFALILGWWCSDYFVRTSGVKDPQIIVIDEVLGIWVTFAGVPLTSGWWWCAGFFLFRFFDILKPLGVRSLEKMKGGSGVLADDLLAGCYANLLLRFLQHWCS